MPKVLVVLKLSSTKHSAVVYSRISQNNIIQRYEHCMGVSDHNDGTVAFPRHHKQLVKLFHNAFVFTNAQTSRECCVCFLYMHFFRNNFICTPTHSFNYLINHPCGSSTYNHADMGQKLQVTFISAIRMGKNVISAILIAIKKKLPACSSSMDGNALLTREVTENGQTASSWQRLR